MENDNYGMNEETPEPIVETVRRSRNGFTLLVLWMAWTILALIFVYVLISYRHRYQQLLAAGTPRTCEAVSYDLPVGTVTCHSHGQPDIILAVIKQTPSTSMWRR
jgi:hypothetical protein